MASSEKTNNTQKPSAGAKSPKDNGGKPAGRAKRANGNSNGKAHRPKRRKGPWPVRQAKKLITGAIQKIDFVNLVKRISQSSRGDIYASAIEGIKPEYDNQDELARVAVELTKEQLDREKTNYKEKDIVDLISRINCVYDFEMHKHAVKGLSGVLSGLFTHQEPLVPFTSPDGRDIAHIKELESYREKGLGVVYLVNHSSHLDEFLVDCLFTLLKLGPPLFAAGQNMMATESLAKVLRLASYTVQRRGASRQGLAALYNYCKAVSEVGSQQAIFLEAWHGGARSRDGTLRFPRRLVALRGALDTEKEVVIQPVAVSYSIIPEDLSLAARKGLKCWINGLGATRTLANMALHPKSFLWRATRDLYGRAYVTMPRPMLKSELKLEHDANREDLEFDEFVSLAAIREIARTKKLMSSQLAARAVLRARKQGHADLRKAAEFELDSMREYHQATYGQDPDLEDFIRQNSLEDTLKDGLRTLKRRKVLARFEKDDNGLPKSKLEPGLNFYATHGDRRIYSPTSDENIVVAGAGDWGFALTHLVGHRMLEDKHYLNASLTLYDPRPEVVAEMGLTRCPPGKFNEKRLPKNAFVTGDATSAFRKASEVLLISPLHRLEDQTREILNTSEQPLRIIVATCGFEPESMRLATQIIYDLLKETRRRDAAVYSLVGPVTDEDLVELNPVCGVLAGPARHLDDLAELFNLPPLSLERSHDALGAQAAAVLARIYALWGHALTRAGHIHGPAQTGRYMAAAAAEATRLGTALGGELESFYASSPAWTATITAEGLSGVNREFGRKIGTAMVKKGSTQSMAEKIYEQMCSQSRNISVYHDIKCAHTLARAAGLELPLLAHAKKVIWG